jgi:hypothetical protein
MLGMTGRGAQASIGFWKVDEHRAEIVDATNVVRPIRSVHHPEVVYGYRTVGGGVDVHGKEQRQGIVTPDREILGSAAQSAGGLRPPDCASLVRATITHRPL